MGPLADSFGRRSSGNGLRGEVRLFDESGQLLVEVQGLRLRPADPEALRRVTAKSIREWLYEVDWPTKEAPEQSQPEAVGKWLVLADGAGVGQKLSSALEERGESCIVVLSGRADRSRSGGKGSPRRG